MSKASLSINNTYLDAVINCLNALLAQNWQHIILDFHTYGCWSNGNIGGFAQSAFSQQLNGGTYLANLFKCIIEAFVSRSADLNVDNTLSKDG